MLHPRIAQRTSIIHRLTDSTSEKYATFLASLRDYARSASPVYPRAAAIASRAPEPPTEPGVPVDEAVQTQPDPTAEVSEPVLEPRPVTAGEEEDKSDASSSTAVSEAPETTKVVDEEDFAPADLSAPLRESLAELSRTLRRYSRRRTLPAASAVPITPTAGGEDDEDEEDVGPPRPPPQALLRSVESFVSMLNTTTYTFPQATRAFVNPYLGGAGAVGTAAGSGDAVASCKSEVRSLKGMLLNRRNFFGRSNTPTPVPA